MIAQRIVMDGVAAGHGSALPVFEAKSSPLEEVVEIIELPEFNAQSSAQIDEGTANIPSAVIDELRSFISGIAAMYNENDFHSFEHGK